MTDQPTSASPDPATAVSRATELLAKGRLADAQAVLIEAAVAHPENGDVFRSLGDVVFRRGDPARAHVLLEYAQELNPQDGRVTELLAQTRGHARAPTMPPARPHTDFEPTHVGGAPGGGDDPTIVDAAPPAFWQAPRRR
jgi:thioredoxin-like negative regulator of GroEL